MSKMLMTGVVFAAIGGLALSEPADARSGKAKIKRSLTVERSVAPRQVARLQTNTNGWTPFPGQPGHRDRTTIYHPNGRLNGQELFDSIADRAGNSGE